MFLVYYVSVQTVGDFATNWANDGVFGEGWSLFGVWIPGIPVIAESALSAVGCAEWLKGLVLDGIIGGVGSVLGFVPQMLVLFLFLAVLEGCGYMARVAFIMDRMFRKFGLSGKSFIPMLIGTGCSVPGIMASRTIENDRDRKMTILTTSFIPCGAKLPIIALIAGAFFGNSGWISFSAFFVGIAAVICSGILLKKTKFFAGDPAPFVMELPAYHIPTAGNILRSMWERAWSFIRKAGTIILVSAVTLWFLQGFGWVDGRFAMLEAEELDRSILDWKMAVAAMTGLIAKENVVTTFGVLFGYANVAEDGSEIWSVLAASMPAVAAYSFLVFNLLCAPCFAAMGAIISNSSGIFCIFLYLSDRNFRYDGNLRNRNGCSDTRDCGIFVPDGSALSGKRNISEKGSRNELEQRRICAAEGGIYGNVCGWNDRIVLRRPCRPQHSPG